MHFPLAQVVSAKYKLGRNELSSNFRICIFGSVLIVFSAVGFYNAQRKEDFVKRGEL